MKASGSKITCMEREITNGRMEENTRENISMIKNMDLGHILGQMGESK